MKEITECNNGEQQYVAVGDKFLLKNQIPSLEEGGYDSGEGVTRNTVGEECKGQIMGLGE